MLKKLISKYTELSDQVKAAIWFVLCSFIQKGIAVISTPVFTRLMTTEQYGEYNVFSSWQGIVGIIISLNLSYGVFSQGLVKFSDDRNIFSSSMQGLSLTLISIWAIIYTFSSDFWNNLFGLTTIQMTAMFILVWSTSVFEFWASEQRIKYKYKELVIVSVVVAILSPIFGIIAVLISDNKATARIIAITIVSFFTYIGLFFIQIRNGKKLFSRMYWKYALLFNIPLIPHYLSQTVLNSADRIMIKEIVSESSAGIYSLAYSVSQIMTLFNTALMQAISPWIYQKIKDKNIRDISKIAYPTLILIATLNILLIALAPEVVSFFAPRSYYDAIWVIPPVAMSVYFIYAYDLFAKFEFYYEKTKIISVATVFGAVLNIVLNIIFIKTFGYIAAGYTTLVCYIAYAVFHYLAMRKICDTEFKGEQVYSLKNILQITVIFLAIGFIYMLTYFNTVSRYGLTIVLCGIIYLKRREIEILIKKVLLIKKK